MTNSATQKAASLDNIAPMMEERAALYTQKKEIEERIKSLDETLRPMLVDRGAIVHNGYQFEVTVRQGAKTLDKKAVAHVLEEHGMDIEDFFNVGAPSSVFKIKEVTQV